MDELGAGLLPDPEFRTILTTFFPDGALSYPKVVTYSRNSDTAIVARYKDGRLRALEAGPALKAEDVEAVAAAVRADAAETRECVYRSIAFSIRRPAGYWRFADRFQILPAPPGAPDTAAQVAPHPLVLEFKVRRSANQALSTMRWTDAETKLVLLLNALLRFGLTHAGFRSRQRWVIATEWPWRTGPGEHSTMYVSDSYLLPNFPGWADDFSDTNQLQQIPTLGNGEPHSIDSAAPLEIPSYLAPGVAWYYALTAPERDVFNRALYWFAHARAMYGVSSSAAFAALVQAIEALAAQPGPPELCPECKKEPAARQGLLRGRGVPPVLQLFPDRAVPPARRRRGAGCPVAVTNDHVAGSEVHDRQPGALSHAEGLRDGTHPLAARTCEPGGTHVRKT